MADLNNNIPYLRKQVGVSMSVFGSLVGNLHNGKPIATSTIQTYEASSTPPLDVIKAMVRYFQEIDPEFRTDQLLFTDLEAENYRLPADGIAKNLVQLQETSKVEVDKEIYEGLVAKSLMLVDLLSAQNNELKSRLASYEK